MKTLKQLMLVSSLVLPTCAIAAPAFHQTQNRFHAVNGQHGVVAAQEQLAAQAGIAMLQQGGNAVDAAVATSFALMVTLPRAGSLGGGGFVMIALKKDDYKPRFIDFREVAPDEVKLSLMKDSQGHVDSHSWKAVGVPGNVAGLCYLEKHDGQLTLEQVMAPAIKMATEGIVVKPYLANGLNVYQEELMADSEARSMFTRADGQIYQTGDVMKRPALANSLRVIAQKGPSVFYKGRIGKAIVKASQKNGGFITAKDLANYHVVERQPLEISMEGYRIFTAPPPSSGGIAVSQLLQLTQYFNVFKDKSKQNTAESYHALTELFNHAFLDRDLFVGDPDFVTVPVNQLLSSQHIASMAASIDLDHHHASSQLTNRRPGSNEGHHTTHISAVDDEGDMVALTYSINYSYGSGIAVPGTGVLLNNTMMDFNLEDKDFKGQKTLGQLNLIQPGKRPLSSMTPVIIENKHGMPWLATGSPGGPQIITAVSQQLINMLDYHNSLAVAIEKPRIHAQLFPDVMLYESGISPDSIALLQKQGHEVQAGSAMGSLQSVMHDSSGYWGFSDTRRAGAGVATY